MTALGTYLRKLTLLSLAGCVLSALATVSIALAAPPLTVRVSVSSSGAEGNSPSSNYSSAISAKHRYVAFDSSASNLVEGDSNDAIDIFVRDLKKGVTQRVSVDNTGVEGNSISYYPALSANGRYVAFYSYASNLIEGDHNDSSDIFVRDLKKGLTQRVSVSSEEIEANYGVDFETPALSANGRYVAFYSYASNLVPGDDNGFSDLFVRDLKKGVTQRVFLDGVRGTPYGYFPVYSPSISANGRFVTFTSTYGAGALMGCSTGFCSYTTNVVVYNLKTGVTKIVSDDPEAANNKAILSYSPSISASGRYISFGSTSSNLVEEDNNGVSDVFVRRMW
ncbi:TolB-like translocation protein [Methylosarcina fibrata]|uniref:PD40 domain-containing protein n=1 Tax=Methylosarcina fibrata TaxID=105972 RepID=UPI0003A9B1CF|nr:PD40 domain-containing protein [Methylosarcina fibrata]